MAESHTSEAEVALAWRRASGRRLTTAAGQRLIVLHPGYPGSGPGPDFRDAILAGPGGRLQRGDVEVHQHAADWVRHGHHRDSRYLGVILQVVGQRGLWTVAPLADGRLAPTVVLPSGGSSGRGTQRAPPSPAPPCGLELPADEQVAGHRLRRDGLRRFLIKARRFQAHLLVVSAEQALYEGVAEAAGYRANGDAFRALARALPLESLARQAAGVSAAGRQERLERELVRAGGLAGADGALMDPNLWSWQGLRPRNSPLRRAGALAAFLDAVLPGSLVEVVEGLVRLPSRRVAPAARRLLGCGGRGFGSGRADDIAVNVFLPFLWARVRSQGRHSVLGGLAVRAYVAYPSLPDYAVLRGARSLLPPGTARGACQEQGLLHRVEGLCRRRPCWGCPLQGWS